MFGPPNFIFYLLKIEGELQIMHLFYFILQVLKNMVNMYGLILHIIQFLFSTN